MAEKKLSRHISKTAFEGSDYVNDHRTFSVLVEDPLLQEKFDAEQAEKRTAAQRDRETPAKGVMESIIDTEQDTDSDHEMTADGDMIRGTGREGGAIRAQAHLQSADLFDYFSPLQKERQNTLPKLADVFQPFQAHVSAPGTHSPTGGHLTCIQEFDMPDIKQQDGAELKQRYPNIFMNKPVRILPNLGTHSQPSPQLSEVLEGSSDSSRTPPGQQSPVHVRKPLRVGLVLSGGPAPGGHNVIAGVYDYIKRIDKRSELIGFMGGLDGLFQKDYCIVTDEGMARFRNTGGFDMFWSGRGKVSEEAKPIALQIVTSLDLNGLIIVGGDGSNSNAAIVAEYFGSQGSPCKVIGVPKTIDGDLRSPEAIECSFGFDTAAKTYSELIGNLCTDVCCGQGVWHFVRVMGRSASHLVMECAMQTRPNLVFIGEEIEKNNTSLSEIVSEIVSLIQKREAMNKNYGIVLVPEGLIEFIPEMKRLIADLSMVKCIQPLDVSELSEGSQKVWSFLPQTIRDQLLGDREATGYIQVAKIATERLLILLVEKELERNGFSSDRWNRMHHYFGYEGRCAIPSNFDANYCYNLGCTAGALIENEKNGYMAVVKDLVQDPSMWCPCGIPFTRLMRMIDFPDGTKIPGIEKKLVDIESETFKIFNQARRFWKVQDFYRCPGPIQFDGPVADISNYTVHNPTLPELLHGDVPSLNEVSDALAGRLAAKDLFTDNELIAQELSAGPPHRPPVTTFPNPNYEPFDERVSYTRLLGVGRSLAPKCLGSYSPLQHERIRWIPPLPPICLNPEAKLIRASQYLPKDPYARRQILIYYPQLCRNNEFTLSEAKINKEVDEVHGLRIGVVFMSRQAPGMINILWGVYERVKLLDGVCIGFYGIDGLLNQRYIEINDEDLMPYKNMGGVDLIGRGVSHELLRRENQKLVLKTCRQLDLSGLILVGSSLAMTEAAILTEYFIAKQAKTKIIGVPATASNNVLHELIETNVGFDTASKLYSSLIGNVLTDAASMPKYWHFVRLMGRQPSNEVLECALQTHPNVVIIAEEYGAGQKTLADVVNDIADVVCARAEPSKDSRRRPKKGGRNFGAVLIPDGLWHHLPTMRLLIKELDSIIRKADAVGEVIEAREELFALADLKEGAAASSGALSTAQVQSKYASLLSPWSAAVWKSLPRFIQTEFLTVNLELRDSYVETEVLLSQLVKAELSKRKAEGTFRGNFQAVCHYFGYQGRSAMPSSFDASLGFAHGHLAAICVESGLTGHITTIRGLCGSVEEWKLGAIPFNCLLTLIPVQQDLQVHPDLMDSRKDNSIDMPIVPNAEVNLSCKALRWMKVARKNWADQDRFCNPGPIQFWGTASKFYHRILHEEQAEYFNMHRSVQQFVAILQRACDFGVEENFLKMAYVSLNGLLCVRFHGEDVMQAMAPVPMAKLFDNSALDVGEEVVWRDEDEVDDFVEGGQNPYKAMRRAMTIDAEKKFSQSFAGMGPQDKHSSTSVLGKSARPSHEGLLPSRDARDEPSPAPPPSDILDKFL